MQSPRAALWGALSLRRVKQPHATCATKLPSQACVSSATLSFLWTSSWVQEAVGIAQAGGLCNETQVSIFHCFVMHFQMCFKLKCQF